MEAPQASPFACCPAAPPSSKQTTFIHGNERVIQTCHSKTAHQFERQLDPSPGLVPEHVTNTNKTTQSCPPLEMRT